MFIAEKIVPLQDVLLLLMLTFHVKLLYRIVFS